MGPFTWERTMVHVNILAVLVTTVIIFILGWVWYSPLLFYRPWMRARGIDPTVAMQGAKMPGGKLLLELARCFVLAYIVTGLLRLLGVTTIGIALHTGTMLWIAFPVILLIGSAMWENVPWKVAAIHAGDWLVKLLVIPIVATLWR